MTEIGSYSLNLVSLNKGKEADSPKLRVPLSWSSFELVKIICCQVGWVSNWGFLCAGYWWEEKATRPLSRAARVLSQIRKVKLEVCHLYYLSVAPSPICLPVVDLTPRPLL